MLLANVLKDTKEIKKINFDNFNPLIKGIHFNSKKILRNFIFVAIKGEHDDGHKYINEALKNGAKLIVVEKKETINNLKKKKIKFIYTKNSRSFLSKISSNFFIYQPKFISAVTGTNGKTSVSNITQELWKNCNINSASLGTLGLISNNFKKKLSLTTEDSINIYKILSNLSKKRINNICIEASSHGLKQHRIDNVKVDVAAITNISRDHFDYHKNFNNYFNSKMRLFLEILKKNGTAIINSDLKESKKIIRICKKKKINIFTYGYNSKDLKLISFCEENNYKKVKISYKNKIYNYKLPIIGDFQVFNSLCAISIALHSGVLINRCLKNIKKINQIPGRLEFIKIPKKIKKNISIFLDYAHTPDAIENVLKTLKRKKTDKLSIVFGCGGDRDKKKRPMMGEIANKFADKIYITDDNPRNESANKIRKEIIFKCPKALEIKNRYQAIKKCISSCEDGEKVLIAGKGHEEYQIIKKKFYKFNDKKAVLKVLKNL